MSRRRRAAGDGPAVTLPTLVDGSSCSELNFTAAFENLESYLCFAVHGDRSEELGCAIGRVLSRYEKDSDGAYLQLAYEGCDDEYYRWYIQNEGKQGGLPKDCLHHLCRRHVSRCGRAHRQPHVVHIQKWCPVTRQEAHDILRGWGLPGLRAEPAQSTHALQTTPKSRAQKPAATQSLPAPGRWTGATKRSCPRSSGPGNRPQRRVTGVEPPWMPCWMTQRAQVSQALAARRWRIVLSCCARSFRASRPRRRREKAQGRCWPPVPSRQARSPERRRRQGRTSCASSSRLWALVAAGALGTRRTATARLRTLRTRPGGREFPHWLAFPAPKAPEAGRGEAWQAPPHHAEKLARPAGHDDGGGLG